MKRKDETPRYRRIDLINWMPVGEQKRIDAKLGLSRSHVSSVLNGKKSQSNDNGINIIRLAEAAAAKARCKIVRR